MGQGREVFVGRTFNDEEHEVRKELTNQFGDLYDYIEENVKMCRERSLALTKLEEAAMWANKAISKEGLL